MKGIFRTRAMLSKTRYCGIGKYTLYLYPVYCVYKYKTLFLTHIHCILVEYIPRLSADVEVFNADTWLAVETCMIDLENIYHKLIK